MLCANGPAQAPEHYCMHSKYLRTKLRGFCCLSSHLQILSSENWAIVLLKLPNNPLFYCCLCGVSGYKHEGALFRISLAFVYPCVETSRMSILELNGKRMEGM